MKISFYDNQMIEDLHQMEMPTAAKVFRAIHLLERFGADLRMPHSKKVTSKLFELRTKGQEEIRILFTYYKGTAVLIHLFKKKSSKIPAKEIQIAENKITNLT